MNNGREDPLEIVRSMTDGLGADVTIEAVGVPVTFELAVEMVRPGGRIANIGVHGQPATLHLEDQWTRDITITTGLPPSAVRHPRTADGGRQTSNGRGCHGRRARSGRGA